MFDLVLVIQIVTDRVVDAGWGKMRVFLFNLVNRVPGFE